MRIRDPYINSLEELIENSRFSLKNNQFWFYILYNLFRISNHFKEFLSIFEKAPFLKENESNSNQINHLIGDERKIINPDYKPKFSLDESLSQTHITPFHLSFYNHSIPSKSIGQFFTPRYISRFIVSKSIQYLLEENRQDTASMTFKNLKFADIACGSGNLLLPLLKQLYEIYSNVESVDDYGFFKIVTENIYCFDLDPLALWISKLRTLLFLSNNCRELSLPEQLKNFQLGNSLVDDELFQEEFKDELNYHTSTLNFFTQIPLLQDESLLFDCILSNPPYMCYGLRNAQKYPQKFKDYLKERFVSAQYKLSLYPIFMERSIELLNDSGILGIITPDSHLLGRFYSKIREYLLANTELLDLSLLGFEPFKGATLGRSTISFFRKKMKDKIIDENIYFLARWIPAFVSFINEEWEEHPNYQNKFLSYPYNRFHIFFSKEDEDFVLAWSNKATCTVGDIASIHTGVRSKAGKKHIISKSKEGRTWKKGIISGRQVYPFHVDYQDDWINVNPSLLWSGGFDANIVENPKIILRQTGYNVISCVDIDGYYHLNNCHSLSPKDKFSKLYALSVILNSSEFNRVYHILSMEKGRALAQIDIEFLLKMPILTFANSDEEKLENFYFQQNEIVRKTKTFTDYSLFKIME